MTFGTALPSAPELRVPHWIDEDGQPRAPLTRADQGFGFSVVQTVFEGAETNRLERLRETQLHYDLKVPFN